MAGRKKELQPEAIGLGESLNQAIDSRIRSGLARLFEEVSSALKGVESTVGALTPARGRGRPRKASDSGHKCDESGCTNDARSKGLCSKHYQKARRAALKPVEPAPKPVEKPAKAKAKKTRKKDAAAPAVAA